MDAESIKWAVSQGIGATLAVVMFLIYRKDVHNALNSWREQTKILTNLVQECTRALQANTDAVRSMDQKLPHACPMVDQIASGSVEVITRRGTATMDRWVNEGRVSGGPPDNR
jgi:hypothetical protein